jgi:small subunit ribosomal protein S8
MAHISDTMVRIKNGYMSGRKSVTAHNSRFAQSVLARMKDLGFIKGFEVSEDSKFYLKIFLAYDEDGETRFTDLSLASKPGQRQYVDVTQLKPVMSGFGYAILSTPKGILTQVEAKKQKTGGELLFKIW